VYPRSPIAPRPRRSLALQTLLLVGLLGLPIPLAAQVSPDSTRLSGLQARVEELAGGDDPAALARAWQELGTGLSVAGRPGEAREAFQAAIREAEAAGDSSALAASHNSLGRLYWTFSDYEQALENLIRARDLRVALGDRVGLGPVLNNIGVTHYQGGNYEPALQAFLQSLELRREAGDLRGEALVLTNIGRTYQDWGQFDRALPSLREALAVADRLGDPVVRAYALHNLGVLDIDLGEHDLARARLQQSLALYEAPHPLRSPSDSAGGRALNLAALGLLHVREGDPAGAIALLEGILPDAEADMDQRRRARVLLNLGYAYRASGAQARAVSVLEEALALSSEYSQRTMTLEALEELASLEEERGDARRALAHLRSFNALRDSVFSQSAAQAVAAMEARAETERQQGENLRLLEEQREQEGVIARQRLAGGLGTILLLMAGVLVGVMVHFNRLGREREALLARTNEALEGANAELRTALSEVRTLKGLIPICAHCKKVRDDSGFWEGVESYITSRSEASFSHAICTDCGPMLYGSDWENALAASLEGAGKGDPARFAGSPPGDPTVS
jgi:tetratricopeptide (TPR) repeat protein